MAARRAARPVDRCSARPARRRLRRSRAGGGGRAAGRTVVRGLRRAAYAGADTALARAARRRGGLWCDVGVRRAAPPGCATCTRPSRSRRTRWVATATSPWPACTAAPTSTRRRPTPGDGTTSRAITRRMNDCASRLYGGVTPVEAQARLDVDPEHTIEGAEERTRLAAAGHRRDHCVLRRHLLRHPRADAPLRGDDRPAGAAALRRTTPRRARTSPVRDARGCRSFGQSVVPAVVAALGLVPRGRARATTCRSATQVLQTERLSRFQRMEFVSGHGEGWALYAERLMDELGYFDDPPRSSWATCPNAGAARGTRGARHRPAPRAHDPGRRRPACCSRGSRATIRAARVWDAEIGPRLPRACARCSPTRSRRSEVDRYLGIPGQAICYKVGERVWLAGARGRRRGGRRRVRPQGLAHEGARARARWASTFCATSSPAPDCRARERLASLGPVSAPSRRSLAAAAAVAAGAAAIALLPVPGVSAVPGVVAASAPQGVTATGRWPGVPQRPSLVVGRDVGAGPPVRGATPGAAPTRRTCCSSSARCTGRSRAARAVVRKVRRLAPPGQVQVWTIVYDEPGRRRPATRRNARKVDLNRNFPHRLATDVHEPRSTTPAAVPPASPRPGRSWPSLDRAAAGPDRVVPPGLPVRRRRQPQDPDLVAAPGSRPRPPDDRGALPRPVRRDAVGWYNARLRRFRRDRGAAGTGARGPRATSTPGRR